MANQAFCVKLALAVERQHSKKKKKVSVKLTCGTVDEIGLLAYGFLRR